MHFRERCRPVASRACLPRKCRRHVLCLLPAQTTDLLPLSPPRYRCTSRKTSADRENQPRRWFNDDDEEEEAFFSGEEGSTSTEQATEGGARGVTVDVDSVRGDRDLDRPPNLKTASRDSLSGREREKALGSSRDRSSGGRSRSGGPRDSMSSLDSSSTSRRSAGSRDSSPSRRGSSSSSSSSRRDGSSSRRDGRSSSRRHGSRDPSSDGGNDSLDSSSGRRDGGGRDRERSSSRSRASGGREGPSKYGSERSARGSEDREKPARRGQPSQQPQHTRNERQRLREATAEAIEQSKQQQQQEVDGLGWEEEDWEQREAEEAEAFERERVQHPRRPSFKYAPPPDSMSAAAAAASTRPRSARTALGVPAPNAAIANGGTRSGESAAHGGIEPSSFRDATMDEMLRLVQVSTTLGIFAFSCRVSTACRVSWARRAGGGLRGAPVLAGGLRGYVVSSRPKQHPCSRACFLK